MKTTTKPKVSKKLAPKKRLTKTEMFKTEMKAIKKLNKLFTGATKPEQRILIARDVITQVQAKKFIAKTQVYFSPEDISKESCSLGELADEKLVAREGKELQHVIAKEKCTVCGIGGLFASMIRINNNYQLNEQNLTSFDDDPQSEIHRVLKKSFSCNQIDLIEQAFELDTSVGCSYDNNWRTSLAAKLFGLEFREESTRLIAIMQNIIDNKGTFDPVKVMKKQVKAYCVALMIK